MSVNAGKVVRLKDGRTRQFRSKRERRQIVEETLKANASVALVARAHGVNANQVFKWRRQYKQGRLEADAATTLLPVKVSDVIPAVKPRTHLKSGGRRSGIIDVGSRPCASTNRRSGRSRLRSRHHRGPAAMIALPTRTQIWIAAGVTDLRRGFTGLSAVVQTALQENPFSGHVFVFRGRRGDLIKVLWWDGDGLCLFAKRLERGRFVWPQADSGTVSLTRAQLSMLLEGIDWRRPMRTQVPQVSV